MSVLALAPVLFLLNFLFVSPVSDLVLSKDGEGAESSSVENPVPVVVVLFDEFSGASLTGRDGRIDASRYPNFAKLARSSTWYRNATTVADETPEAVPAPLSGRRPAGDQLPIAADHPDNLFTMLGDRYRLNVSEPATDLCPERLCGGEGRAGADTRLRGLFDDLSVVSAYLVLPCSSRRPVRRGAESTTGPRSRSTFCRRSPSSWMPARAKAWMGGRCRTGGSAGEQIEVRTFSGDDVTTTFGEFTRQRDREVRRRIGLFGAGNGFAGVFAPPARRELVGRRVAELPVSSAAAFGVEFDFREGYGAFSPGSSGVPAFITWRPHGAGTRR